jgi:hypothetical protein
MIYGIKSVQLRGNFKSQFVMFLFQVLDNKIFGWEQMKSTGKFFAMGKQSLDQNT